MDLDQDGHIDLLSGSWPGEIFLFRGGAGRTFAAPVMLRDKDGNRINIGGGIEYRPDGTILITGHVEWEETEERTFANYGGKRIESTIKNEIWSTGTASAAHACDWDGDGDMDLLIGEISGKIYLVPNIGTADKPVYGKEIRLMAGFLKPIEVAGDAGPFVADWDGDGDHDLLVGAGDGSVSLFRNNAVKGKLPALAAAEQLVAPGLMVYGGDAPKDVRRGHRSKICAVDWNGDGLLDLLVGDITSQKPDLPEPTPEQQAEYDRKRAELDQINESFGDLMEKVQASKDKAARDKALEEFDALQERMSRIQSEIPPEYEDHGWVWLFLRKPTDG